jgi:putative membrane protein
MKDGAFKKVVLAVTVCALAVPVLADDMDTSNPAATSMMTPADFAWEAGLINLEEIRLGQAAQSQSHNKAVQKFGMHMVRDHSKMEDQLSKIAASEGLQLPDTNTFYEEVTAPEEKPATEMMPESPQQKLLDAQLDAQHLASLKGHDFDQAYADAMVKGHEKATQDFENASDSLQDSALKKYAGKGAKTIRHHCEMAQRLQSQVSTNAPAM